MNLIPWAKPNLTKNDINRVKQTLNSGWISGGSDVGRFEDNLKNFLKSKYVCVTNNGTSAINLSFLALGLKPGDEIIVPGFGYMAAANIGKLMGLKIKFADVCIESFCTSLKEIKKLCSNNTKLIVVTHTYGNMSEIEEICRFAKQKKIYVLEDCAESLGSIYNKKQSGTFGDIGTFSFHATKTITTGEGGAICTKSKKIYEKIKLYRSHGVRKKRYYHYVPGHNFRLTNFQCSMGISQFKRIKNIKKKRQKIYQLYLNKLIKGNLNFQIFDKNLSANIWTFSVLLNKKFTKKKRDILMKSLLKKGIETRNGFYSAQELKYFNKIKNLPNSKRLSDRVINLPLFEQLTKKQINYIAKTFLKFL